MLLVAVTLCHGFWTRVACIDMPPCISPKQPTTNDQSTNQQNYRRSHYLHLVGYDLQQRPIIYSCNALNNDNVRAQH